MFNKFNKFFQEQIQQRKEQRMETFSKLLEGKSCTREELEIMQKKHEMYKKSGHYISVLEKDANGFNIQPKELMDIYYIPIPTLMSEIKILKRSINFADNVPKKENMLPLEQKYFQAILLKHCFAEIRSAIRIKCENNKSAVQKIILGKYSFERYLNYEQRLSVSDPDRRCIVEEDIDVSVVPVPKLPVPKMSVPNLIVPINPEEIDERVKIIEVVPLPITTFPITHQEVVEAMIINAVAPVPNLTVPINPEEIDETVKIIEVVPLPISTIPIAYQEMQEIVPGKPIILNAIETYENPMDYYINLIQWCVHCSDYNDCPEALKEAIFELMGNEGKYKEVFSNPEKMLQFIKTFAKRHQYFTICLHGEEKYAEFMEDYIAKNGRYFIMQKVTRMLGHWGLSQEVKINAHLALKDHFKVTHQHIRNMYLNPEKLARWLKAFIPDSYTTKDVDAAIARHGFYYY